MQRLGNVLEMSSLISSRLASLSAAEKLASTKRSRASLRVSEGSTWQIWGLWFLWEWDKEKEFSKVHGPDYNWTYRVCLQRLEQSMEFLTSTAKISQHHLRWDHRQVCSRVHTANLIWYYRSSTRKQYGRVRRYTEMNPRHRKQQKIIVRFPASLGHTDCGSCGSVTLVWTVANKYVWITLFIFFEF